MSAERLLFINLSNYIYIYIYSISYNNEKIILVVKTISKCYVTGYMASDI